jgi:hypothetical protein
MYIGELFSPGLGLVTPGSSVSDPWGYLTDFLCLGAIFPLTTIDGTTNLIPRPLREAGFYFEALPLAMPPSPAQAAPLLCGKVGQLFLTSTVDILSQGWPISTSQ